MPVTWAGLASTWARPTKDNQNSCRSAVIATKNQNVNWTYKISDTSIVTEMPVITPNSVVVFSYASATHHYTLGINLADGSVKWTSPDGYCGESVVNSSPSQDQIFLSGVKYYNRISWIINGAVNSDFTIPSAQTSAPLLQQGHVGVYIISSDSPYSTGGD